jgi:cytoplasmic iron level regulating protein YaaA (DUF328/UPF0246 family)
VLVLLPPSETKAAGGSRRPLDLARLGFRDLDPVREKLLDSLAELAADPPAARAVLGLTERQEAELAVNAALRTSPTRPALRRYTGVLYDALDYPSLSHTALRRANASLVVASALFGLVRATDPIPNYRLSGGTTLPGLGPLGALWRPALGPVLAGYGGLVVDLRSGAYAALAPVPSAVTVRVLTVRPDGSRAVVSHFNKAHKGRLAHALVSAPRLPGSVNAVAAIAATAGFTVERPAPRSLDLLVQQALVQQA